MNNLPHVSPYSGLAPDGEGTGIQAAINMLFTSTIETEDGQTLVVDNKDTIAYRVHDIAVELGNLRIMENQVSIAADIALYHAAQDYCTTIDQQVEGLFPAIARNYHALIEKKTLDDNDLFFTKVYGYDVSKTKDAQRLLNSEDNEVKGGLISRIFSGKKDMYNATSLKDTN